MGLILEVRPDADDQHKMLPSDGPLHIINEDTGEHIEIRFRVKPSGKIKVFIQAPMNYSIERDKVYKNPLEKKNAT